MRHLSPAILVVLLTASTCLMPTAGHAEQATEGAVAAPISHPVSDPSEGYGSGDHRLYAVGAGAIVGVVAFNMLTYPFGSVPFVAGALAETPVDIALGSRLLAAIVGGAGALAAHYLYTAYPETDQAAQ